MAYAYLNVAGTDVVADTRDDMLNRDDALRECFKGTAFPVAGGSMLAPIEGQLCYRTDLGLLYQCTNAATPTWAVVNAAYFLALAGGTLTGLLKLFKGATKAAASTVDLSTRTGNFIHISGNTTITAFTIDAGDIALLCFDGAPSITLSSTLVGPPTSNTGSLQMAANDMIIVVGDGSGVARIAHVMRIDGKSLVDTRYQLADGTREFAVSPVVTGKGKMLYANSGNATNSGKVSWGTGAPGTLDEGEVYLRHA
jgi:hypothetical protein